VALLFLASLGLRVSIIIIGGPEYALFLRRVFPSELCLFLAGYFSYVLYKKVGGLQHQYFIGLLAWAALLFVLMQYNQIHENYALALLAFSVAILTPCIFSLSKDSKIDRFLGNISFPIYMVHFLVIACLDDFMEEYSLWMLLSLVFVIALAVHYGIEMPIDYWRQRRVKPCRALDRPPFGVGWCFAPSALKATV
jgi:peptidoglycan/LPS O-acetylase OafA/YrhL